MSIEEVMNKIKENSNVVFEVAREAYTSLCSPSDRELARVSEAMLYLETFDRSLSSLKLPAGDLGVLSTMHDRELEECRRDMKVINGSKTPTSYRLCKWVRSMTEDAERGLHTPVPTVKTMEDIPFN